MTNKIKDCVIYSHAIICYSCDGQASCRDPFGQDTTYVRNCPSVYNSCQVRNLYETNWIWA